MKHAQRGQVLPLWILAIITTFTLTFLALNYGNQIQTQIRAQNAADAAAQALLAIQTERWNMMTSMLYASSVEEYRIRHVLDGMLLAVNGSGGCNSNGRQFNNGPTYGNGNNGNGKGKGKFAVSGQGSCGYTYLMLLLQYERAVNRYTADVKLINDITTRATNANFNADAQALFLHLKDQANCNTSSTLTPKLDGGDCLFQYTLNRVAVRNAQTSGRGLTSALNDSYVVLVPTQGFTTSLSPYNTPDYENQQLFAPPMVDVVVCTKVQPLIPAFGVLGAKPYYAVGRAGATAQIFENDWFQPGQLIDPVRAANTYFQPYEQYDAYANHNDKIDWYGTLYGGLAYTITNRYDSYTQTTQSGYRSIANANNFSAYTAWWSSIPIDPRKFNPDPVDLSKTCPA